MEKPKRQVGTVAKEMDKVFRGHPEDRARLNAMARFLKTTPEAFFIESRERILNEPPYGDLYRAFKAGMAYGRRER